jgi:hypothetical protein
VRSAAYPSIATVPVRCRPRKLWAMKRHHGPLPDTPAIGVALSESCQRDVPKPHGQGRRRCRWRGNIPRIGRADNTCGKNTGGAGFRTPEVGSRSDALAGPTWAVSAIPTADAIP